MRPRRFPPAVYECPFSGTAFGSPQPRFAQAPPRKPPYSAWPEIRNRWGHASLPTLSGAIYRPPLLRPFTLHALSPDDLRGLMQRAGCTDPDIFWAAEQTLVRLTERSRPDGTMIQGDFNDLARSILAILSHLSIQQSLRTGAFLYLYAVGVHDPNLFFSHIHESIHTGTARGGSYGGILVRNAARDVFDVLDQILDEPSSTSPRTLVGLWNTFGEANDRLSRRIRKLRPLEEAVATWVTIETLTPAEARHIEPAIERKLRRSDFYETYLLLRAEKLDVLRYPRMALDILSYAPALVHHFNMDAMPALQATCELVHLRYDTDQEGRVDRALQKAKEKGVEKAFSWLISKQEAFRDSQESVQSPLRENPVGLDMLAREDHIVLTGALDDSLFYDAFRESIRQQISQLHGLYCPYEGDMCKDGDMCKEGDHTPREALENVWKRLPAGYRVKMTLPRCLAG